jgi:hypothetical protein
MGTVVEMSKRNSDFIEARRSKSAFAIVWILNFPKGHVLKAWSTTVGGIGS